ncbi:hypothetical protein [Burkholderia phage vB_BpP_HN05]
MTQEYPVETILRVYDSDETHYVEIGPSPDFPGNVIMSTKGKSAEYFGDMRIDMPAEFMRTLGHALIKAADNEKEQQ